MPSTRDKHFQKFPFQALSVFTSLYKDGAGEGGREREKGTRDGQRVRERLRFTKRNLDFFGH